MPVVDSTIERGIERLDGFWAEQQDANFEFFRGERQADVFHDIHKFIAEGGRSGIVKTPGSTGKGVMYLKLLEQLKVPAIIGTPGQFLLDQVSGKVDKFDFDLDLGRVYQHAKEFNKPITLTTYHSMLSKFRDGTFRKDQFKVLILDEGHECLGEERRKLIEELKEHMIVIGFTATPNYHSQKQLQSLLGPYIHWMSIPEAVEQELNAPFSIWVVRTDADLSTVDVVSGDFNKEQLELAVNKKSALDAACELHLNNFYGHKGFAFCAHQNHARDAAAGFNAAGISAVSVTHDDSKDVRKDKWESFVEGDVQILTGVRMPARGVDVEEAIVAYHLSPCLSAVEVEQRSARVTRPLDGKHAYIIHFLPKRFRASARPLTFSDVIDGAVHIVPSGDNGKRPNSGKNVRKRVRVKGVEIFTETEEVRAVLREHEQGRGRFSVVGLPGLSKEERLSAYEDIGSGVEKLFERVLAVSSLRNELRERLSEGRREISDDKLSDYLLSNRDLGVLAASSILTSSSFNYPDLQALLGSISKTVGELWSIYYDDARSGIVDFLVKNNCEDGHLAEQIEEALFYRLYTLNGVSSARNSLQYFLTRNIAQVGRNLLSKHKEESIDICSPRRMERVIGEDNPLDQLLREEGYHLEQGLLDRVEALSSDKQRDIIRQFRKDSLDKSNKEVSENAGASAGYAATVYHEVRRKGQGWLAANTVHKPWEISSTPTGDLLPGHLIDPDAGLTFEQILRLERYVDNRDEYKFWPNGERQGYIELLNPIEAERTRLAIELCSRAERWVLHRRFWPKTGGRIELEFAKTFKVAVDEFKPFAHWSRRALEVHYKEATEIIRDANRDSNGALDYSELREILTQKRADKLEELKKILVDTYKIDSLGNVSYRRGGGALFNKKMERFFGPYKRELGNQIIGWSRSIQGPYGVSELDEYDLDGPFAQTLFLGLLHFVGWRGEDYLPEIYKCIESDSQTIREAAVKLVGPVGGDTVTAFGSLLNLEGKRISTTTRWQPQGLLELGAKLLKDNVIRSADLERAWEILIQYQERFPSTLLIESDFKDIVDRLVKITPDVGELVIRLSMHRSDNVKGLGAELLRQIGNKPLTQRVIDSIDLDNPDCNDSWSLLEVVFKQLPPSEQLVAFLIDALDAWKEGYRVRSHTYYWSKRDNISHCFNRLSKDGLKYWKRKLSLRQRNEHGPQHHLDDLIKIVDQKLETVDDRLS